MNGNDMGSRVREGRVGGPGKDPEIPKASCLYFLIPLHLPPPTSPSPPPHLCDLGLFLLRFDYKCEKVCSLYVRVFFMLLVRCASFVLVMWASLFMWMFSVSVMELTGGRFYPCYVVFYVPVDVKCLGL